jgi:hypothetical protein
MWWAASATWAARWSVKNGLVSTNSGATCCWTKAGGPAQWPAPAGNQSPFRAARFNCHVLAPDKARFL